MFICALIINKRVKMSLWSVHLKVMSGMNEFLKRLKKDEEKRNCVMTAVD